MYTALNVSVYNEEPCKNLLASIIERAILDLRQPLKPVRDAARKWIFSSKTTPFSFLWCLHWLDMDGTEVVIRYKAQKIIDAANRDLASIRYASGSVYEVKLRCVS